MEMDRCMAWSAMAETCGGGVSVWHQMRRNNGVMTDSNRVRAAASSHSRCVDAGVRMSVAEREAMCKWSGDESALLEVTSGHTHM